MTRLIALAPTIFTLTAIAPPASEWIAPDAEPGTSWEALYLAPETQYGAGHRGVDFEIEVKGSLLAPTSGSITFEGVVVDRNVVTLKTNDGYLVSFEPACTDLEIGAKVSEGASFAWHCAAPKPYQYHCENCVHFSVRSSYGYLSPEFFVGKLKPSALLG